MKQVEFENIIEKTASWPGGSPTHLPTDDELQAVSSLVKEESVQLKAIDDEIKRLKTIVSGLENERSSLARQMEAHRAYISHIRRIPDDMVREIMIRCIPTDPPPSHFDPEQGPALLARICSDWRTIALSTPQLWSSLCVSFRLRGPRLSPWDADYKIPPVQGFNTRRDEVDSRPLALWQKDVHIMRYWLSHSGSCPLTLSFGYIPNFSNIPAFISDFFNFLIDTSPRWESIDLIPTSSKSPTLPLSFRSAVACQHSPQLQSIRFPIVDLTGTQVQELSWINSEALKSPKLHRLTCDREMGLSSGIHGASDCNSPLSLLPIVDWGKMTVLYLNCTNAHEVEDCIMVLAMHIRSPLEAFSLKLIVDERWPPAPNLAERRFDIKSLPYLYILDLDLPHDFLQKILRMITAPSLAELSIQMSSVLRITPDSIAADLLQFLKKSSLSGSGCTGVQTLRLNPIHYTRQTLYHVLETLSGIRRLVFKTEYDRNLSSLRHANVRPEELWVENNLQVTLNRDSNIDDEFLFHLVNQNSDGDGRSTDSQLTRTVQFLPQLVDFTCLARTSFSLNTLAQFLRARHQHSTTHNTSRLQVLRLIEVNKGYVGESSLLAEKAVWAELLPFKLRGLAVAIVNIHQPEGSETYARM